MRNSLRVPDGVGNRNRTALRYAKKSKAFDTSGIDYRFEVIDKIVKADVRDFAVRQSVAARVVADDSMITGQLAVKMPPNWAFKIIFERVIQLPVLTIGKPSPMRE